VLKRETPRRVSSQRNALEKNMKSTLVVLADLGCLKAFKLEKDHQYRTPHLEMLEQFENPEAYGRLVDKVTDYSGRFPRGIGTKAGGAMSDGERHNIQL